MHESWKNSDKINEAIQKAEDAIASFEQAGGVVHSELSRTLLAVRVKVRDGVPIPELRDDDYGRRCVWETLADNFWNYEMDNSTFDDELLGTKEHHFPKVYGMGRSSGHLGFVDTEGWANLLIRRERSKDDYLIGYAAEDVGVNPEGVLNSIDEDEENDVAFILEDVKTFFDDATKWVEHVKSVLAYTVKCLKGQSWDFLCHTLFENDPGYFDLSDCVVTVKSGKATISWPQHARVFDDRGKWIDCGESDEGATLKYESEDEYHRWVPDEKEAFEVSVTVEDLRELLWPEAAKAKELLR